MKVSIKSQTEPGNSRSRSPQVENKRFTPGNPVGTAPRSIARFAVLIWALGCFVPLAQAATLVHDFYLPMPEAQIKQTFDALETGVGTTLDSTFAVVVTGDGTVIYYDQWEDGYEVDLAHPTQSSTRIWGDGNNLNGIPPGFVNDPQGLSAGTAITLRNNVPLPRNPSNLLFDGRDRVSATKALVISRMAWPTSPGSVLADAVQVPATIDYGTNYISPIGQDMTNGMFQYVALLVLAGSDNTSVTIDPDGSGPTVATVVAMNRGESYLVNGGINKGATVTATKPVQANLVVGKKSAKYASDWFGLVPTTEWGSSYVTPVPTSANNNNTYVYLYNPDATNQTINYLTRVSSGSFVVSNKNVFQFLMPKSSGARFTSAGGGKFFALSTVAATPGNEAPYDWGFSLLPTDNLTTVAVVGLGLGSSDNTQNGSPVWVSPLAVTRIYVDYKGDHAGSLTDPSGGKYDTNFDLVALQSQKIYDPTSTNKSQTGMRIYTLDGTYFSTAWGEDSDVAASGNPYIDAGTTVLPFPTPTLEKSSVIVVDTNAPGLSVGDTVEYTITLNNRGLLPLGNTLVIDSLPTNIAYVANTTKLDNNTLPDDAGPGSAFPLDAPGYTIPVILREGTSTFKYRVTILAPLAVSNIVNAVGYNLAAQNIVAPPPSAGATSCGVNFTDSGGTPVATYGAGGNVYVKVTDGDANTFSNSVQTMSVVVSNLTSGDFELVTLNETGANTGIFLSAAALPTSVSIGLGQQDGTLNVSPGNTLSVYRNDSVYGDTCSATAVVSIPTLTKVLYLSGTNSPNQDLDRINPAAAPVDNTTSLTALIGAGGSGGGGTNTVSLLRTNTAMGTGNSLSITNVAVTSVSNRLLLVAVGFNPPGANGVTGMTYNGQALSLVISWRDANNGGNQVRGELWRLVNPPVGTTNVAITFTGSPTDVSAGAMVYSGVDQTSPLSRTNTATGTGNSPSITIVSSTNDQVFSILADRDGTAITATGVNQTRLWSLDNGAVMTAGNRTPGAASVTNSWTVTSGGDWSAIAVSIRGATNSSVSAGTNVVSFNQTPTFCSSFVMPSGGAVSITNFVTVSSGSLATNPAITATLRYGGTTFIALTNASYNSANSNLVWTGALTSNVTVTAGQAITYSLSNIQASASFQVNYDSAAARSKISLPTTTVIDVTAVGVYDAPYPGGSLVSTPLVGTPLYVRVAVSDPFGSYDISSVGLNIDGPGASGDITTSLTNSSVVASNSCSKTYEYAWNTTLDGTFSVVATANEGSEGITDVGSTSLTLIVLDTGTPSTTEFTSGNNGVATNAFPGNGTVCIRVADSDKNTNAATQQTIQAVITSGAGDSENVTLTETSANSGIFAACITALTNSPVTNNNTILTAPVSTVLTVTYVDPSDVSDESSATATVIPPPGTPRVTMNKTIVTPTDGQASVGESVVYNLQVVNSGSTLLTNIAVTDNFPSNKLSYVSASVSPSSVVGGLVTWTNIGSLTVGSSTNIQITFTATSTTNSAVNRAVANAGGSTTNLSTVSLVISHAALTITKTIVTPTNGPVSIGSNVTFQIVVQNTGDTAITNLPLEDTFSASCYSYVSASITPDGTGAGSLLWNDLTGAGSLAVNASITNTVVLKVTGGCDPADNTAHADYAMDSNGDPVPPATSTAGITTGAARITGSVYNDADQTGTLTGGDTGLNAVSIALYTDPNADGDPSDGTIVRLATTDATGAYELLNLATGAYVVVETDLPGYGSVAPLNNRLPVTFTGLTTNANNNFFDYLIPPISYATVSGTVWADTNANGVVNLGETGIFNVTIELVQDVNTNGLADLGETVAANTTTATNGTYSFTGVVPGRYVIRETDLYGWISTADSLPPSDNQIGIGLGSGAISTNNNFLDFFTGNNPGNDVPVANNDTYGTSEDAPLIISAPGILGNDTDVDGDTLRALLVSTTTNGTLSLSTNGNFIYTPNSNYFGVDVFTYRANDGTTNSGIATVNITIAPVNDTPVANNDAYTTPEDTALTIPVAGILTNDTDVEGSALTALLVSTTTSGTLALNPNGSFTYTPNTNFNGGDLFTYRVTDGSATSGVATVTITVTPVNDTPVANNDAYTTAEDTALTIPVAGILTNDTDVDGNALTALLVTTTTNGVLSLSTNGSFVYTPNANYFGVDSFTYRAVDGVATSAVATVTITITSVDDAPVANPDSYAVNEDGVLNGNVSTNDVPSGDGGNVWTVLTNAAHGVVVLSTNGTFTYTPTGNYNGPDSFTYQVCDADSDCSPATVTITVNSVDDAPVANPDSYAVNEDGVLNGNVSTNDVPSGDGGNVWSVLTNAAHGVVVLSTNGTFTYTPTGNYNGPDSFTYQVCDADNDCSPATVTITVNSVDDAPVANADSYAVNEDGVLNGNVSTNDVPSGDGGNVWTVLTNAAHGVVVLSTNGTFTYTPTGNYNGPDSFTYHVCDADSDCSPATVTITVNSVDDAPVANPDSYAVNEDGVLNGNVSTNDVLSGDGGNVWSVLTNATHGVVVLSTNGTFTYTPTGNYNGPDSFTYQVCDADNDCSPATVTITVNSVDDAPVANADSYAVNEDGVLNGNVSTNDVPSGDGGNVWSVLTNAAHGVVVLSTNGTFTYTPTGNYNGPDSFTYQVCDADSDCSPATVTITVNSVDDAPVANPDSYTVNEDGVLNGNVSTNDVLSGDGGNVWTVLTNVAHGVLSLSTNGTFTYTPTGNYNGPDSFTYQVCDADSDCSPATVTITVNSVDDAPVANPDGYFVLEDGVLNGNVSTNDVPSGDGGNVWTMLTNVTHGVLSFNPDGTFIYTPTTNYNGPDSFTYQVCDADSDCSVATVTISVSSVDNAPVANPDSYAVNEDGVLNGNVSTNDVPSGDGGNVWSVLTNATHGVVVLSTNGTFTYTPTGNYNGPDSFTYQVCDADNDCSPATVTITVNSVDDAPVANPDSYAVNEDGVLNGNVATNDVPSGDGGNVWTVLTNAAHGVVALSTNGTFTYTPTGNYNGPDSFTYQVCDADSDCSPATVTITVNSVDDAPVANPDSYAVNEDGVLNGNVATNDVPSGDGGNVWSVLTNAAHGVVVLSTNGTFTYTPTGNYNGPDSFIYQVCDADSDCSPATVTITVNSVDDAPVANPDGYFVLEDGVLNGNVSTNDVPSGDGGNVWTMLTNVTHGVLSFNPDGTFTYTPTTNYNGPDSFTYQVCDADSDCSVATVTISVSSVDNAPVANPDSYAVNEDGVLNGNVSTNDVPSGDGGNVWTVLTNVAHGVLSLSTNGTFTYTPTGNYNGPDSFTYQVCDVDSDCSPATVTITVNSVDDAPVANPDSYAVNEDGVLNGNVSTNDVPSGDGGNVWTVLTNAAHGVVVLSTNGTFTYTPTGNYNGPDSFTYQVCDADSDCSPATVTITVNSVDDAPVANPDSYAVNEDGVLNGNVSTNDVPSGDGGNVWTVLTNAAHGVVALSTNGTFTYTPTGNYNGPDSFTYQVCDADSDCSPATVTITVNSVDDAPVANPDSYAVNEDGVLNGNVATNDVPSGDGGNVWSVLTNAAHGVVVLSTNGTFTYTPTGNYNGPDSFIYQVCDADSDCSPATVTITVNSVDDAPVANPDSYAVNEDGVLNGNVSTNDVLSGDGGNVWTVLTNAAHGVVVLSTNGTFTYTPTGNYNGPDSFTYQVCDADSDCSPATVTITVNSVDDAPVANPDSYAVNEDGVLNGNVSTNDVLSGDGGNVWTVLTNVAHGVLSLSTNGTFTYTPTGNYNGPDSFTYQVCDADSDCSPATVTITVNSVDDAPAANPDSYTVNEDGVLNGNVSTNDVLSGDGGNVWTVLTNVAHGVLSLSTNGTFTYTPTGNYNGPDSFTYQVCDADSDCSPATVTITVNSVDDAPVANPDSYAVNEDGVLNGNVSTNDVPSGDGGNVWTVLTNAAHGVVVLSTNGTFTYTPTGNYNGPDSFTYHVCDADSDCSPATVTITVNSVDDAPVANPDSYAVNEDGVLNGNVSTNDVPSGDGGNVWTVLTNAAHGVVVLSTNGTFTYTPTGNYNGPDSFTYRVCDADSDCSPATVTITVNSVNDVPVANPDNYTTLKNIALVIPAAGILTNDTDVEGSILTVVPVTSTANGSLVLNVNGGFTYTPNSNYFGSDSFTYRATDGSATSAVATVTITIQPTNTAPTTVNNTYTTPEDTTLNIPAAGILTNDIDPDGDTLSALLVANVTQGTLTLNPNGSFSYTPNTNYNGSDSFTYRAYDALSTGNVATVTINVTPVNDPPIAVSDSTNTFEDVSVTINVLANDSDPEGTPLTITGTSTTNGVIVNNVTSLLFTPTTNFNGTAVFSYTITDGTNTATTNVTVTVTPRADLMVFKTGAATWGAGSNLTYTVTATNAGLSTASNVVLNDQLPTGFIFVSAVPSAASVTNNLVTWSGFDLASFGSSNFTVTARPTGEGVFTNIAFGTSTTPDPNSTNNNGTSTNSRVTTVVQPRADVAVFKAGPTNVLAGDPASYTITVTNRGPSVATNTVAIDTLPAGVTFQSASGSYGFTNGIVTWAGVTLASGGSATYTVTITAPPNGTLTNVASATALTPDPDPTNNDGSSTNSRVVTTVTPAAELPASADLGVFKTGPASVVASSNALYTITVTNYGYSPATNVLVSDTLPAGALFQGASGIYDYNNGIVTWAAFNLASNGVASFTVTIKAPASGTLTNVASATSETPDPEPSNNDGTSTNSQTTTVVTALADVRLSKSAAGSVNAGANLVYTLIASNAGPSTASSLSVTDSLPTGVTFVSATGGGTLSGNQVIWPSLGNLAAGASTNLTLTVTAPGSGTLSNTAVLVTPTSDPNLTNNTAGPVVTTVQPLSDVAVFKYGPASIVSGGSVPYTLVVTNGGPSAATSLSVTDSLPANVTFLSASSGGVLSGNKVIWANLGGLAVGATTNLTLTVTAPMTGGITNVVSATSSTPDPNPSNNNGTSPNSQVDTAVTPIADLVVGKTGPSSITTGVNFAYTISVTNLGPLTATNVVITDLLPTNLVFVSATGGGVATSNVVTWPLIATLANGGTTNYIITVRAPASGNFTNIAVAVSTTPDPNTNNNSSGNPGAQVPTTAVAPQFGFLQSTNLFNPQTGLFEQRVTVTNTGASAVAGFRLLVGNINGTNGVPRTNVYLYNATGTNIDSRPYVQYNATLNPGSNVTMILEFYVQDRKPFTNSLEVVAILPNGSGTNNGGGVRIDRAFTDYRFAPVRFVLEWPSIPGTNYTVIYSDASASGPWTAATPSVTANANRVQWYDDGPPKTTSVPLSVTNRFYRVIQNNP